MTPINNLQIAVKNNTGIYYFQTLVPIHILFVESGKLEQDEWFKNWQDNSLNEYKYNIANLNKYADIKEIVDKLQINNVFCIAERYVNNMNVLYLSVKLEQNVIFVMEMLIDQPLRNVKLSTKTAAASLVSPFQNAIEEILKS
ncbi:Subdomain of clathrin and coatomer appendage domain-containing protein [Neocallimastix californiae]|uniref:Subdomain of clathrin and coatomer appendage domain-containing protein n=1 Tax=Neocallimastix californiae TaxID=1754190 RepID=A0A1Y2D4H9_9FUNG|nr:Subdomain of clathrin and coatomer appendage domain-containing protein [Neocallimastix californiae]|eukprot:ORY54209.1 Subdomain of clathrin and coatomer appendage domain-containing protein [Neocallimastix californiae]